jgi:hypothetical protein
MTSRKPQPIEVDLTQCKIPGGIARFYTPKELSNRRRRLLGAYEISLMPKMQELAAAQKIIGPKGEVLASDSKLRGLPVGITVADSKDLIEMNDAAGWAYLKSWSVKSKGEALPLPVDVDDFIDNYPGDIVDAIVAHAAKIVAENFKADVARKFTVDGVEDEESPSGA